jgi:EAL domain-containing protein (putative c-di-GMP-specific phosphodiesterase class I)
VNLKTGALVGSEALLRWLHPEWGLVRPARFIPLAEETGLIVQIGEWVVEEACRQNRAWQVEGLDPGVVSVNLSARQFRQEGLVRAVSRILGATGLDRRGLEMEITESMVMHNAEAAIAICRAEVARRDAVGGRLWHRLLEPRLPEGPAIDTLKIDARSCATFAPAAIRARRVLAQAIISLGTRSTSRVIAERR